MGLQIWLLIVLSSSVNKPSDELNSLMFSDYKNATTGKALIGIAPHGGAIIFSDIYPGKITDSETTVETGAINLVDPEYELMSARAFAISELCAEKGVYHNKPAMKMSDQFEPLSVLTRVNG